MNKQELSELVQVRTPDYAALGKCVIAARGKNRTMAQFAETCGLTQSMLSRIVNCKMQKPLSTETLYAIYEHRDNIEDEMLLDALARANGLGTKEMLARSQDKNSALFRRDNDINKRIQMKNTILNEVFDRGIPISRVKDDRFLGVPDSMSALYPRTRPDFALQISPESSITGITYWAFHLVPFATNPEAPHRMGNPRFLANEFIRRFSNLFLIDSWDPTFFDGCKISFLFSDEKLFYEVINILEIANLHNEMTLILIDCANSTVEKEVWISGHYKQMTNISIFDIPKEKIFFDEAEELENDYFTEDN